jgi:hypothetical protein
MKRGLGFTGTTQAPVVEGFDVAIASSRKEVSRKENEQVLYFKLLSTDKDK